MSESQASVLSKELEMQKHLGVEWGAGYRGGQASAFLPEEGLEQWYKYCRGTGIGQKSSHWTQIKTTGTFARVAPVKWRKQ